MDKILVWFETGLLYASEYEVELNSPMYYALIRNENYLQRADFFIETTEGLVQIFIFIKKTVDFC